MCGKRFVSLLLLYSAVVQVFSQSVSMPLSALETIREEAALIRRESSALKALLSLSETESAVLENRLNQVEADLTRAEALLTEASLNLETSEAALLPLQEDLEKLGNELTELKKQAEESNRRLALSQKKGRFWMTAAISLAVTFAAVELGRILVK
jgi:septal ring factor EnvC (AmiA/AmiB activator)